VMHGEHAGQKFGWGTVSGLQRKKAQVTPTVKSEQNHRGIGPGIMLL